MYVFSVSRSSLQMKSCCEVPGMFRLLSVLVRKPGKVHVSTGSLVQCQVSCQKEIPNARIVVKSTNEFRAPRGCIRIIMVVLVRTVNFASFLVLIFCRSATGIDRIAHIRAGFNFGVVPFCCPPPPWIDRVA